MRLSLSITVGLIGYLLVYSAFTGEHPKDVLLNYFGGQGEPGGRSSGYSRGGLPGPGSPDAVRARNALANALYQGPVIIPDPGWGWEGALN